MQPHNRGYLIFVCQLKALKVHLAAMHEVAGTQKQKIEKLEAEQVAMAQVVDKHTCIHSVPNFTLFLTTF